MRASREASSTIQLFRVRFARAATATVVDGAVLATQVTLTRADTLAPAVDDGGCGSGGQAASDMLRGDYRPIPPGPELAVTEVTAIAEQLRGDLSPIDHGLA